MTTPQQKIQEILQEVRNQCSKGDYIFRGENEEYEEVSSGLYRQYFQSSQKGGKDSSITQNKRFPVVNAEKNIVKKARQHIRPDAPNIEVLTELQHYGGKTALLDFTKDIHIALFFACDGSFDKDGRVILFKISRLKEKSEVDYEQIDNNEEKQTYTLVPPTGKNPRAIFQSSIFAHVPKGYLEEGQEEGKYETIKIEQDIKKPLLDYLSKHFNIKAETIEL